jgi:hypothetical protein
MPLSESVFILPWTYILPYEAEINFLRIRILFFLGSGLSWTVGQPVHDEQYQRVAYVLRQS